jgi:hypothetical protein
MLIIRGYVVLHKAEPSGERLLANPGMLLVRRSRQATNHDDFHISHARPLQRFIRQRDQGIYGKQAGSGA